MSSSDSFTNIWRAVNINLIDGLLLLITYTDIPVHGEADKHFHQLNRSSSQDKHKYLRYYSLSYGITFLVTRSNLLPLGVFVFRSTLLFFQLVVLVFPLVVFVCQLAVLVCSLVLSVCPLVVFVALSVGLFITDRHPHYNTTITFGTGSENAKKKQKNFILRYYSLKFLCDQIIKTIGLILPRVMFVVTIALFLFYC